MGNPTRDGIGSIGGRNSWDLRTLAMTLWGEAEGEGERGMIAVCHVILNRRAAGGWFGASIAEVCLKPLQFSCWNADSDRVKRMQEVNVEDLNYLLALRVACQAILQEPLGDFRKMGADETQGATHYHTLASDPKWDDKLQLTATIGHHKFYKERV